MEKLNYNVLSKSTGNKEVVRISVRMEHDSQTGKDVDNGKKAGYIASYALKALVKDKKEVYISYISSAESKLPALILKKEKVLLLMNRMLQDSLETICGGFDQVPMEYVGKHLTVMASLPYNKETAVTSFNGKNQDGSSSFKALPGFEEKTVKATYVRLFLVETTKE